MSTSALAEEVAHYEKCRFAFLKSHPGEFVLIKRSETIGFFKTEEVAIMEGYRRFFNRPFLVHQIVENEPIVHMPFLVFEEQPRTRNPKAAEEALGMFRALLDEVDALRTENKDLRQSIVSIGASVNMVLGCIPTRFMGAGSLEGAIIAFLLESDLNAHRGEEDK